MMHLAQPSFNLDNKKTKTMKSHKRVTNTQNLVYKLTQQSRHHSSGNSLSRSKDKKISCITALKRSTHLSTDPAPHENLLHPPSISQERLNGSGMSREPRAVYVGLLVESYDFFAHLLTVPIRLFCLKFSVNFGSRILHIYCPLPWNRLTRCELCIWFNSQLLFIFPKPHIKRDGCQIIPPINAFFFNHDF